MSQEPPAGPTSLVSALSLGTPAPQPSQLVQVPPDRLPEAISRVMIGGLRPDLAQAEVFIEFAASRRISVDMCFARVEGAGYWPVCLVLPNPGRTALFFTSAAHAAADVPLLAEVIRYAHDHMDRRRVALAQAMLKNSETALLDAFIAAGFTVLAELAYIERKTPSAESLPATRWPTNCRIHTYTPDRHADFREALLGSYQNTRDCPGLCGLRDVEDVLIGHRGFDPFDPSLWTVAYVDDRPAGVLFLSQVREQGVLELSYIGVTLAARGRGLGSALINHTLDEAVRRGVRTVTLAVDLANEPAMSLYRRCGFYRVETRLALIRPA